MDGKICCFTGHRSISESEIVQIPSALGKIIDELYNNGVREFRAGGAIGFDTLAALKVISYRELHPDVRLHLILPCRDQDSRWGDYDKKTYRYIIRCADSVSYIENTYTPDCMHRRNRSLVNGADFCVAYLSRGEGGSAYTVNFANRSGVKVINLYGKTDTQK